MARTRAGRRESDATLRSGEAPLRYEARAGFDEYYTYDGLDRLEKAERGTLAGSPYSSITSHTKRQDFRLEALGNWKEFKEDAGPGGQGKWDLEQVRLHNQVNEIDSDDDHLPDPIDPDAISESQGQTAWIVPGYDAAGKSPTASAVGSQREGRRAPRPPSPKGFRLRPSDYAETSRRGKQRHDR